MPPTYNFALSRNQIVISALEKIGELAVGDDPTPEQLQRGIRELNVLVQSLQNEGIRLWSIVDASFPLVVGQASYNLPSETLDVFDVRLKLSSNTEEPIELIAIAEYDNMSRKDIRSQPYKAVFKYAFGETNVPTLTFYPVPNKADTIVYKQIRRLADVKTNVSEAIDIPPRWYEALIYGLAHALSDAIRLPLEERNRFFRLWETKKALAKRGDYETVDNMLVDPTYPY